MLPGHEAQGGFRVYAERAELLMWWAQLAGGRGARCYIAVAGGLATPSYLGSRATFPSGRLGGTQARLPRALHAHLSSLTPSL